MIVLEIIAFALLIFALVGGVIGAFSGALAFLQLLVFLGNGLLDLLIYVIKFTYNKARKLQ